MSKPQQGPSIETQIAHTTLKVAAQNLETAKLAHKKMVEQLSMRTATIAQMAAVLMTRPQTPSTVGWGAKEFVVCATEIMVEAELSAAKEKELQGAKDSR